MFEILHEDNHIIVAEKPQNTIIAGDITGDESMFDILKQYIKEKYNKPGDAYLGLVHRLDRPAGGLAVFARTSKAASRLQEQLKSNELKRTYYCVVRGVPANTTDRLVNYLKKNEKTNTVEVVPPAVEGAKKAILNYKLLQTVETKEGPLSLIQVQLETGRSHQIRVQMAHMGCALWGDQRYGFNVNKKGQQLALYAVKLRLIHPTKKESMQFICYPPQIAPWTSFRLNIE
ncbi:MAG: RluA family pseudouridine synthase [Clostridiales bacterium]|nr:RluA family pseudouridine synthase [Clostridiales bacterium]